MQTPDQGKTLTAEEQLQSLQDLADSYLFLADLLRKQANIEQASQAMLKAIEIEQDLPDHLLCLGESYKQLADDFYVLEDCAQCVQACELGLQIELQLFDEGVLNPNIQESLLFLAEAYAAGQEPVKSNEQLSNILEAFGHENISDEVQIRTLTQVVANLTALEQFEECIQY